ncbi:helix-turn-helix transcriptional regulator [Agromyces arachidis]|uniref:helix-turn-helix transcriptional regulator n=1 Tax=Agromyces arachidis TaxID=766966 RepID=UPI0040577097
MDVSSFATSDPDAARAAFAPIAPRLEFGRVDPEVFRAELRARATPGVSVFDFSFAAPSHATFGSEDVVVVTARGRGADIRHRGREIDLSRPHLNASDGMTGRWEALAARAVVLDRARVEALARAASGDPGLRLEPVRLEARGNDAARLWNESAGRVAAAMAAAPEAFDHPIVIESAFSRLAVAYLHAFDLTWDGGRGASVPVGARSKVVRAALDYFHAHAGEPITVAHVAEAVHISSRGLHAAFVAETGRSPSEHLRGIRLEGVRDELRFAPPSDTIAVVARRWGFVHLPRFAHAYQQAFGELPSATRAGRQGSMV